MAKLLWRPSEYRMGLRASDTVELIFEDCRVPSENLLGQEKELQKSSEK